MQGRGAVYHCVSRVVGREHLIDDVGKELLVQLLWKIAGFCGVEIITYCMMDNHFHILVRVPEKGEISDVELVERVAGLYGARGVLTVLARQALKERGKIDADVREGLVARMGDVSEFMKEFKQRFSRWYNRRHDRDGAFWSERFRSVLVEDQPNAVEAVAAYIDLNPVRAGLVADPKDYRFCGYAAALAGNKLARNGLMSIQGAQITSLGEQRQASQVSSSTGTVPAGQAVGEPAGARQGQGVAGKTVLGLPAAGRAAVGQAALGISAKGQAAMAGQAVPPAESAMATPMGAKAAATEATSPITMTSAAAASTAARAASATPATATTAAAMPASAANHSVMPTLATRTSPATSMVKWTAWPECASEYRMRLFTRAGSAHQSGKVSLSKEKIREVLQHGGQLSLSEVFRLRVRHMTDGMALGTKEFVNEVFTLNREKFSVRRKDGARPIRFLASVGLNALRDLRVRALG